MRSARSATATDAEVMPIALAARFGSFSAFKSPKPPSFVASTASRGPETWYDQVRESYAERGLFRNGEGYVSWTKLCLGCSSRASRRK